MKWWSCMLGIYFKLAFCWNNSMVRLHWSAAHPWFVCLLGPRLIFLCWSLRLFLSCSLQPSPCPHSFTLLCTLLFFQRKANNVRLSKANLQADFIWTRSCTKAESNLTVIVMCLYYFSTHHCFSNTLYVILSQQHRTKLRRIQISLFLILTSAAIRFNILGSLFKVWFPWADSCILWAVNTAIHGLSLRFLAPWGPLMISH